MGAASQEFDSYQRREGLGPYAPPRLADREKLDDVLRDVRQERERQVAKGYTAEHDDEHGVDDLTTFALRRLRIDGTVSWPIDRQQLVEAAAVIVATIESIDRRAARGT